MANPNPSRDTRFKPGNRANPRGASAHNPAAKLVGRLTNAECIEILNIIVRGYVSELRKIANDPNSLVLKAAFASIAMKAIRKGDANALDKLLDRLVGKVKDQIEVAGDTRTVVRLFIPPNGRESDADAVLP